MGEAAEGVEHGVRKYSGMVRMFERITSNERYFGCESKS